MKKRMPNGKVVRYIYLTEKLDKKLAKFCIKEKRTVSACVEIAIEKMIDEPEIKDNNVEIG